MNYRTVKNKTSAEFTEKKSRFIGYICPVTTEEEALEFIAEIKAKHRDARHNVYAYIVRKNNIMRYSDDGEPQGTAGFPSLEVLQKEGLTDVAVVVTRYFGGILLGGGGLLRAYSRAVKDAVDAAVPVRMEMRKIYVSKVTYPLYNTVIKTISACEGIVSESEFLENVKIKFSLKPGEEKEFKVKLDDATNACADFECIGEEYICVEE